MLNSKSFLTVDLGAATLKIAEFEPNEAGGLRLKQYGLKSLGPEGFQEATRQAAVIKGLQELLAEHSLGARNVNVCAPGFHVFSKFVKLPPVDTSKVTQIIQYEAQQNVPFPLEEVVWDYQILGTTPSGELEVLLVAIKSDVVEGIFRSVEAAGLKMQLVDVSPAALCNAFRYNYGDLEGCTMLLDIGARTSTLLFFEGENVYSRGINIGANSITQDFSKESKLGFEEAERLKIQEGFVSLGGAYEEPENPNQAAISKIARQVMTRLHIQVNQTIQFYRGQQGGSPPQRLFLSGGATIMPYTAQFFAEKLNLPVEYFNPFRNVQIDPSLNLEEVAKVAHSLGEVVGLSLRNLAHCPVELNLMPRSSLKRQQFTAKKPYLYATAACLILILFFFGWFFSKTASAKQKSLDELNALVTPMTQRDQDLKLALGRLKEAQASADQLNAWLGDRAYWANTLMELRRLLMAVEAEGKQEFATNTGMWIESFEPVIPVGGPSAAPRSARALRGPRSMAPPAGRIEPITPAVPVGGAVPDPLNLFGGTNVTATASNAPTDAISTVNLKCRLVSLKKPGADDANTKFAYMFEKAVTNSAFFTPESKLSGTIDPGGDGLTETFQLRLVLKRPLQL
ncbi:MAG: type IV pilus assembly protein PilM [Verrucomicrobia bacterium]|nr:type IV pilus assembly protein PilM [Verrucomicrobiota bacterium]